MCHCTGSVSWNSSTSTTDQRARIRSRAAASAGVERAGQPAQQVVVAEHPAPPLAPVDLSRARPARTGAGRRPDCPDPRRGGSSRACGSWIASRPSCSAVARLKIGSSAPATANLRTYRSSTTSTTRSSRFSTSVLPGSLSPATPEPGQHVLAELVGGDDGRRVEMRQRGGQPAPAQRAPPRRRCRPAAASSSSSEPRAAGGSASPRSAATS